jgi:hypothetical protein|tara:strand:- start:1339 stop:2181 length:843 start_codon:yes stop_codon:yes gene_type:complete
MPIKNYEHLKQFASQFMFNHWLTHHEKLGGYLATSYVGWDILHSPMNDIVAKLEEYKQLPIEHVLAFQEQEITNNSMPNREVMEDVSKIFYLSEIIQYNELKFYPQIVHEPWHNRYRVHPGSGRLMALWLCGYQTIKCIYTHFDEPGFVAPGESFRIDGPAAQKEFMNPSMLRPYSLHVDTYPAFPKLENDIIKTKTMDSEWDWNHVKTNKPWNFMRFSEGAEFLEYKESWRSYALDAWQDLQHDHIQIGNTQFQFNPSGKVVEVTRNLGNLREHHALGA